MMALVVDAPKNCTVGWSECLGDDKYCPPRCAFFFKGGGGVYKVRVTMILRNVFKIFIILDSVW